MQDIPGVNCSCTSSDDPDGAQQRQRPEIIVPEGNEFCGKSVPEITDTHGSGQNLCNECGSRLEWELRLDGVTARNCPNC